MPVCSSSRLPDTLQSLLMRDDFPFTQLGQQARLADTSHRDNKNVVPIGVVAYSGKFTNLGMSVHQPLHLVLSTAALLGLAGAYLTVDFGLFCGQKCY